MKNAISLLFCFLLVSVPTTAQVSTEDLNSITKIRNGVKSRRAGSYDRSGGNDDRLTKIADGESRTLLDIKGAGLITRLWVTIAPAANQLSRNDIILRMYWDGNKQPSVVSPIGPFFGQGWQESYSFGSAPLAVAPDGGLSMTSYFAMPFARGARIEIENQTGKSIEAFYYNIDYTQMKALAPGTGRFHAWFNREITAPAPKDIEGAGGKNLTGASNYLIADIKGHGQFVGINYYVQSPTPVWYGEGDEMLFIDGERTPSIVGTGTEDYFNTAWCPKETYSHPYFGIAYAGTYGGEELARLGQFRFNYLGRFHYYRFHVPDPIYFDKSLRFTIEHGHDNNLALDLATVAYWYQSEAAGVPAIPDRLGRKVRPVFNESDLSIWRDAWRKQMGDGAQ